MVTALRITASQVTSRHPRGAGLLAAGAVTAALVLAGCGSNSTTTSGSTASAGAGATTAARSSAPAVAGAVLRTAETKLGTIVVDAQGRTVYMFAADKDGKSACEGECLEYWPIVKAPATLPASLPGITGKIGSLTRSDGTKQLILGEYPLYTFAGDSAPGQTNGQGNNGSGALWWVMAPNGEEIESGPAKESGESDEGESGEPSSSAAGS